MAMRRFQILLDEEFDEALTRQAELESVSNRCQGSVFSVAETFVDAMSFAVMRRYRGTQRFRTIAASACRPTARVRTQPAVSGPGTSMVDSALPVPYWVLTKSHTVWRPGSGLLTQMSAPRPTASPSISQV